MAESIRWPDFSDYGMRLVIVRAFDGTAKLGMVNGNAFPARLNRLGFVAAKSSSNLWLASKYTNDNGQVGRFSMAPFRALFPDVKTADTPMVKVWGASPQKPQQPRALQSGQGQRTRRAQAFFDRLRDRVEREISGVQFPATVNLMTDYTPGEDGEYPATLVFDPKGYLERVDLYMTEDGNNEWVHDSRFRLDVNRGVLTQAWIRDHGELTPEMAGSEWDAVAKRLQAGTLTQRPLADWYNTLSLEAETNREMASLESSYYMGHNLSGEPVYECEDGRFVSQQDGTAVLESIDESDLRFLRAGRPYSPDWTGLLKIADNYIKQRDRDDPLSRDEIRTLAATVFGVPWGSHAPADVQGDEPDNAVTDAAAASAPLERTVVAMTGWANDKQAARGEEITVMALEAGLALNLRAAYMEANHSLEAAFAASQAALRDQTESGADALPLPLAVVMRAAMGQRFATIADCNAESPVFLGLLPASSFATLLVDEARMEQFERWFRSSAASIGIRHEIEPASYGPPIGVDRMLGSLTTGSTQQAIKKHLMADNNLSIERKDHQRLVAALQSLDDNGVAAFLIDADTLAINAQPAAPAGQISDASGYLVNWLHDNFHVGLIADLQPNMFTREAGDSMPSDAAGNKARRLIVIQGRREEPAIDPQAPHTLNVYADYNSLWSDVSKLAQEHDQQLAAAFAPPLDNEGETDTSGERITGWKQASEIDHHALQVDYQALSAIAEPTNKAPKNLAAPMRHAMDKMSEALLKKADGTTQDVDDYVCSRLGFSRAQLKDRLAPEQVDAIALNDYCRLRRRAMILGDETGVGKGRTLAAISAIAAREGEVSVFVTERVDLFRDFWRDVINIGAEHLLKPMVINANQSVYDQQGHVVDTGTAERTKQLIDIFAGGSGAPTPEKMPENLSGDTPNLYLMTYSQVASKNSTKARLLEHMASFANIILDEAHRGAGQDSNTAHVMGRVINRAKAITYSSSTFAKTEYNLELYRRALPESIDTDELRYVIRKGGEPLQEAFSSMLAEDGVLIRRENDLGTLTLNTVVDEKGLSRNREYADIYARCMSAMANVGEQCSAINKALSSALAQAAEEQGIGRLRLPGGVKPSNNLHVTTPGFGSRFHNLTKQLLLAIKADFATERAMSHIKEGRKPLIILENTMESLLRTHIDEYFEARLEQRGYDINTAAGEAKLKEMHHSGMVLEREPQYRDLLYNAIDAAFYVRLYNSKTKQRYKMDLRVIRDVFDSSGQAMIDTLEKIVTDVRKEIDQFPDMSMSPIDTMLDRFEKEGIECGELTARTHRVRPLQDGTWVIETGIRRDRAETIAQFNSGSLQAAIANRSVSTGSSMHASEDFLDQKQRVAIEVQVMENVTDRIQSFGRIRRRGEVCPPIIEALSSGIPAEQRILAMQNLKLRRQNATTTSNRQSVYLADTVDILNQVGDEACRRYLETHPAMAARLSLKINEIDDETIVEDRMGSTATSLSNLVTSRMILLDVQSQESLYRDLRTEYQSLIAELNYEGNNPLRVRELPTEVSVLTRQTVYGQELNPGMQSVDDSVFEKPVSLARVTYHVPVRPIRSADVIKAVNKGQQTLQRDIRSRGYAGNNPHLGLAAEIEKACWRDICRVMKESKDRREVGDVYDAIRRIAKDKKSSPMLSRVSSDALKLIDFMRSVVPGSIVDVEMLLFKAEAVITGIETPLTRARTVTKNRKWINEMANEDMGRMQSYAVNLAIPGKGTETISLSHLLRDSAGMPRPQMFSSSHPMAKVFDEKQARSYIEHGWILDGNPFMSAMVALKHQLKAEPVVFDEAGCGRKRGMYIKHLDNPQQIFSGSMIPCDHFNLIPYFLQHFTSTRLSSSLKRAPSRDVFLRRGDQGNGYVLSVPHSRFGAPLREDPDLDAITSNWKRATRSQWRCDVADYDIKEAVALIYSHGKRFMIGGDHKDWLNEALLEHGAENHHGYLRNKRAASSSADVLHTAQAVGAQAAGP